MIDKFIGEMIITRHPSILSCEAIAEMLINEFNLSYCAVMEDDENGAEVSAADVRE